MDFKQLHKKYFQMNLKMLPHHYTGSDTNRMTLGMFMIMSLELLGIVDEISSKEWVDWIYSMQLIYKQDDIINAGFRGGPFLGDGPTNTSQYDAPHLTMTYSALLSLFVLKDDMSRLHRQDIIDTLSVLQKPDGSAEHDMRFVFCACAISFILNDWSGFDVQRTIDYIVSSQNYDGGFGFAPHVESYGGSTFCALASLHLLNKLDLINKEKALEWCISRQHEGFHGRVNKPDDTCYTYWIGSALEILGHADLIDVPAMEAFLDKTISKYGGYGKHPDSYPDVMHSYMGLAGLAIFKSKGLKEFYCPLGCSLEAFEYAKSIGFCS